jgi:hypothetical protein
MVCHFSVSLSAGRGGAGAGFSLPRAPCYRLGRMFWNVLYWLIYTLCSMGDLQQNPMTREGENKIIEILEGTQVEMRVLEKPAEPAGK